jgi:hypothetical protein
MVPALARPAATTSASSSASEARRLGTGRSKESQWVGAWLDENPHAPAAMASLTMASIWLVSSAVASRS